MKTVTFKSDSDTKIDLLIKVAKEMGIDTLKEYDVPEDDYGLPGGKVSEAEMDAWLSKEEGSERYTSEQVLDIINKDLDALEKDEG